MGAQLPLVPVRVRRRDAQQVPVQRPVGGNGHVGEQGEVVVGEARQAAGDDRLERGARMVTEGGRQRHQFVARRTARRHRLAGPVIVGRRLRGRQPESAGVQGVVQHGDHLLDLLWAGLAADGVAAHRGQPQRRVTDQETGIDGDPAVEAVEPVAERCPAPVEAGPQRVQRHPLHPREHPGQVVLLVGCRGRQREAAVAAEDRGDAVLDRRARGRVPEQLCVVVGVQVDEARRQRLPLGVNGFRGRVIDVTDGDDPPVADADVAVAGGHAGAVDDFGIADEQVEHEGLLHWG